MEIAQIYSHHFFHKNSVKSTHVLQNYLRNTHGVFTKYFSSESKFLVFPHCVEKDSGRAMDLLLTLWVALLSRQDKATFGLLYLISNLLLSLTQCGNFMIFLSLRYYVKSIIKI